MCNNELSDPTLKRDPPLHGLQQSQQWFLKLCLETDGNILKIAACRETNIRYLEDAMPNSPEVSKKPFRG